MSEFKYLTQQVDKGNAPQLSDLELVGDDILKWRLKVKNFDNDVPAGKDLNSDLQRLKHRYGQDHMLMEIAFDADYPQKPFFLRVVSPRCVWYTGHVTAGGSICIAALTLSGGAGSWSPDYSVESILNVVITNMLDCERLQVTTASGGGTSGPLRIDLDKRYSHNPMQPYSEAEARMAFSRMEQHHRQNGWGPAGGGAAATSAVPLPGASNHSWPTSPGASPLSRRSYGTGFGRAATGPRSSADSRQTRAAARAAASQAALAVASAAAKRTSQAIEAVDLTIIEDDALDKDELSRMRAEKEALEKQLEELKQQKQRESAAAAAAAAAGAQRARLIDPPAHWRTFTGAAANTRVQYVELPLGGRAAAAPAPAQLAFDKGLVKAMTNQGLSEEDAIAALEHCQGDGEEAMLYAVECLDRGGAATVARRQARKKRDAQAQAGPSQAEEAERKRQQDEVAEVERVLAHFEQGGLRRDRVHRIERVQNLRLWTKYCMRQDEIEHERGTHGINEQLLFHGADQGTIAIITSSGFDIRVSQLSGSLGAGTYFAHCSSYSDAYSKAPAHAVAAAPAPYAYGGAWAAATAGLGPLGVPAGLASGGLGGAGGGGKKGRKSRKMPPPPPPLGFGAMPSSAAYSMAGLAGLGASLGYPFPGALTAAGPYGGAPAGAAAAGAGAIGASRGRPGEASSSSSQAAAQPTSEPATGPRYVQGGFAMLICRVTLGTQGHGGPQMRRPPPGCDSVTTGTAAGKIYAMYDNTQAYPEWCVHYE
ncbi:hypothetical protein WJX72_004478 [[Myrmecia] bisecta]|uniref:Poly [ADP-ribose] polymerase n=1 Tax=[Myrmecia] bisecta TaxID=41462 RepID=A0AAW1PW27_9CHLO